MILTDSGNFPSDLYIAKGLIDTLNRNLELRIVKPEEIDKLSLMALEDPSTPGNPKKLTLDDMKLLYKFSIEGKLF